MSRGRLTLINALTLFATAGAVAWLVVALQQYSALRGTDELLRTRADMGPGSAEIFGSRAVYVQVLDASGAVLARSSNMQDHLLPVGAEERATALEGKPSYLSTSVDAHSLRVYVGPFSGMAGASIVQAATPMDDELQESLSIFVLSAACGALIALVVGRYLARLALTPIEQLAAIVRDVTSTEDLGRRVPFELSKRGDAVGVLASDINAMLVRLEAATHELHRVLEAQRQFVADASHALRTPLTSIQGNVDLLAQWLAEQPPGAAATGVPFEEILSDISLESGRMSRLVDGLLMLAWADAEQHLSLQPTRLRPVLESVLKAGRWLDEDVGVSARNLPTEAWVNADEDRLQQLVMILVENAVRYTPPGGRVMLAAASKRRDERDGVVVEVTDSGPGVPPEERARIFERFYRGEAARHETRGTGLGLAVASWIVSEHRGTLDLRPAETGGTTFWIWLPTVPEPADAEAGASGELLARRGGNDARSSPGVT